MPGGLTPLKLTVAGQDFSYEAENITFSNADPGGYEMCSFDLRSDRAYVLNPGDAVRLTDGLRIVWEGRVAEPSRTIKHGWGHGAVNSAVTRIGGEGQGSAFKDNKYSMVYIDRDMSRWTSMTVSRQQSNIASNFQPSGSLSWRLGADPSANPALVFSGTWPWSARQAAEAWYDAGPLNTIAVISTSNVQQLTGTGSVGLNGATAAEQVFVGFAQDAAIAGAFNWTQNVTIGTSGSTPYDFVNTNAAGYRFGFIGLRSDSTGAYGTPASGVTLGVTVGNVVVYGAHSVPVRSPGGYYQGYLYLSDIAADAAARAIASGARAKLGRVDTITSFPIRHYVQYTPVEHEQVIDDMAKLGPAHYGTWESSSIFEDTPEWTFRAYDTSPTAFCAMADVDEADLSERLGNLFTSAIVSYSDAAGTSYTILVTLPNDVLSRVGIQRTTTLDLGLSNAAAAQAFASAALQALFLQARSAGSVTLPKVIRDCNGAPLPSHFLKAGIDRLRISDIPVRSGLFGSSESFRISRVESNVDTTSGEIVTRVELDAGPNLLETFQARLAQTQSLVGI